MPHYSTLLYSPNPLPLPKNMALWMMMADARDQAEREREREREEKKKMKRKGEGVTAAAAAAAAPPPFSWFIRCDDDAFVSFREFKLLLLDVAAAAAPGLPLFVGKAGAGRP